MRVFCWNVNSLVPTVRNINLKYGSLAAFFSHLDADIICMQEIKLPDAKLTKDLVVVEGYQSYWSCSEGKTGYSGVTTWARNGFAATSAEADPFTCEGCEQEGRAVMTDHGSFVLFNVYVPNAGDRPARARLPAKLSFMSGLKERVDECLSSGRQVIIVGDLNIASEKRDVHDAINWDKLYHPSELQALHDLLHPSGSDCVDIWRHLHPDAADVYTVWSERTSARAFNVGMRIDYALVSRGLLHKVQSCEVVLDMPPKWSDHAPVMMQLDLQPSYAAVSESLSQQLPQQQETQQVPAEGPHPAIAQQELPQLKQPPECPMWQQLLRRFHDPSQRSIAAMFKTAGQQKAPAKTTASAGAGAANAASTAQQAAAVAGANHGQAGMQTGNGSDLIPTGGKQQCLQRSAVGPTSGVTAASAGGQEAVEDSQDCPAGSNQADPQQQHQQSSMEAMAASHQRHEQHGLHDQQQQQSTAAPSMQVTTQRPSGSTAGRAQQAAGTKRKATSKAASARKEAAKQAKLHAFFARAPKCNPGEK